MNLNIAYSCNEAYIQHTGISMISLFENNKEIESINVYFIAKDVKETSITVLKDIVNKYKRDLIIIPFEDMCYDLKISETGRHVETIYAKLFFSRIKNIDKILYLDSDTIINGSLKDLWLIDISSYLVAGVETYTVSVKKELNLSKEDNFINDGIALLNLELLRKEKVLPKFLAFINERNGNPPLLSEGTINAVCKGQILSLHPKYNLMSGFLTFPDKKYYKHNLLGDFYSQEEIKEAIKSPIIIHYLSAFYNRPWNRNCSHPLKDKYLHYKSISPWEKENLTYKSMPIRLLIIGFIIKHLPYGVFNLLKK